MEPLEKLWDALLSRQEDEVRAAFETLDADERLAVLGHLQAMATETGWHPEQRFSAEAALRALEGFGL